MKEIITVTCEDEQTKKLNLGSNDLYFALRKVIEDPEKSYPFHTVISVLDGLLYQYRSHGKGFLEFASFHDVAKAPMLPINDDASHIPHEVKQ